MVLHFLNWCGGEPGHGTRLDTHRPASTLVASNRLDDSSWLCFTFIVLIFCFTNHRLAPTYCCWIIATRNGQNKAKKATQHWAKHELPSTRFVFSCLSLSQEHISWNVGIICFVFPKLPCCHFNFSSTIRIVAIPIVGSKFKPWLLSKSYRLLHSWDVSILS